MTPQKKFMTENRDEFANTYFVDMCEALDITIKETSQ